MTFMAGQPRPQKKLNRASSKAPLSDESASGVDGCLSIATTCLRQKGPARRSGVQEPAMISLICRKGDALVKFGMSARKVPAEAAL
jgi:hypothetical protein